MSGERYRGRGSSGSITHHRLSSLASWQVPPVRSAVLAHEKKWIADSDTWVFADGRGHRMGGRDDDEIPADIDGVVRVDCRDTTVGVRHDNVMLSRGAW